MQADDDDVDEPMALSSSEVTLSDDHDLKDAVPNGPTSAIPCVAQPTPTDTAAGALRLAMAALQTPSQLVILLTGLCVCTGLPRLSWKRGR